MSTFTDRVARSIGRHFVTLSCVQHVPEPQAMHVHVFSGFVIDIAGEWFYVTAGHILRRIRIALESGSIFDIWRLGDQTAGNRFNNTAVPYAFEIKDWCVLEDESVGLDYAAVHLGGLYRQLLETGGVIAIGRDAWSDHLAEHEHWALVGIPSESVSYDGQTVIKARFVMAPLSPTEPPPLAESKAKNQFFAKLADDSEGFVNDVDGMSGGPVIMLRHTGEAWKYNVIGVQSAWYRSARVVAACPFASFAYALEPVVFEALTKAKLTQA